MMGMTSSTYAHARRLWVFLDEKRKLNNNEFHAEAKVFEKIVVEGSN